MTTLNESDVEESALAWLRSLGWQTAYGPDIATRRRCLGAADYGEVVLAQRLRDALGRLNPDLPADPLERAFRRLTRPEGASVEARNRDFHRMLVDGVTVERRTESGAIRGAQARVVDFDDPRPTTGWRSTSSPSPRASTRGAPTSCSFSTASRWASSS